MLKLLCLNSSLNYKNLEWIQVLCPQALNEKYISRIGEKLKAKGCLKGVTSFDRYEYIKTALLQYQKDNNLPLGRIDVKTLKHLGLGVIL